jgi:hypothetical protein
MHDENVLVSFARGYPRLLFKVKGIGLGFTPFLLLITWLDLLYEQF